MALADNSYEALRSLIDHCLDFTERLSDWEREFMDSISEQLDDRRTLSEKQTEILERIYCRLP